MRVNFCGWNQCCQFPSVIWYCWLLEKGPSTRNKPASVILQKLSYGGEGKSVVTPEKMASCVDIVLHVDQMTGACCVWQANLNLQNFDEAVRDFKAVLDIDPDNKAAKNQLAITTHKIKQIHNREKQTYAGMFQKFAEIDAKVSTCKSV